MAAMATATINWRMLHPHSHVTPTPVYPGWRPESIPRIIDRPPPAARYFCAAHRFSASDLEMLNGTTAYELCVTSPRFGEPSEDGVETGRHYDRSCNDWNNTSRARRGRDHRFGGA